MPVTPSRSRSPSTRCSAAAAAARPPPSVKDEDFVEKLFVAHTHDTILCFCNRGKVYWKRVFELPQAGRGSRGKPMVNLLPLEEGEKINAMLPIKQFDDDHFVFMATSQGTVKKTPLSAFSRPRASGIIALGLTPTIGWSAWRSPTARAKSSSRRAAASPSASTKRKCVPWAARPPACAASSSATGQELISLIVVGDGLVLTASANGYGKLTPLEDFPQHGRGGQGVIALQTTERNGEMVAALQVNSDHELMLISSTGTLVRTPVSEISIVGRNTQGVRLIRLGEGERLTGIERIESLAEEVRARRNHMPGSSVAGDPSMTSGPVRHAVVLIYSAPPGNNVRGALNGRAIRSGQRNDQCAYSISPQGRPRCPWKSSNRLKPR